MAKRVIAGIVGTIAILATVVPIADGLGILHDRLAYGVGSWSDLAAVPVFGLLAAIPTWIGLRFLKFAQTGRQEISPSWLRPLALGIGSFFPGFIFPVLIFAVLSHMFRQPSDRTIDLALWASLWIGIASAIICTTVLLRKRTRELKNKST